MSISQALLPEIDQEIAQHTNRAGTLPRRQIRLEASPEVLGDGSPRHAHRHDARLGDRNVQVGIRSTSLRKANR